MHIVTTLEDLHDTVQAYSNVDAFCFDVETWGAHRLDTTRNDVLWIALSTYGRTDVIPMGHPNGVLEREEFPLLPSAKIRIDKGLPLRESDYSKDRRKVIRHFSAAPAQLSPAEVFGALKPVMFGDALKVGHNLKFDLKSVAKYLGGIPTGPFADTLMATFLDDNRNRNGLGLKDCLKRELGFEMEKGVGAEVEAYGFMEVAKYAYLDAKYTWLLWRQIHPRLEAAGLIPVFRLEMDVLNVTAHMELRGADIDVEGLKDLRVALEQDLEEIKGRIYAAAGKPFNINSNIEKQTLLFSLKKDGGRGLRGKKLTPKGQERRQAGLPAQVTDYSVAADALEPFRESDELVAALLDYADTNKLISTYVTAYLGGEVTRTINGKSKETTKEALLVSGRIHTDFVQWGAETGRFSSKNPNLQNVPAPHTPRGRQIRNLFIAPDDHTLVVADYSQIEPRIIASFSEDPVMVNNYLTGSDIYTTVGDTMGVDRRAGKTLVLAISYDVGPNKIADNIGCTVDEAKELLDNFYASFPAVTAYKKKVIRASRSRRPVPYVKTLLGRRRYLPDLLSSETGLRARAERQAFNTRIQGSGADLMKLAMVRAHDLIPEGSSLVLTVHDELVTVTPNHLREETAEAIREAMEGITALKVPLVADVKVVSRWGEAK